MRFGVSDKPLVANVSRNLLLICHFKVYSLFIRLILVHRN